MMGLILDWCTEKGFVKVAASFEIVWRMYIGYSPGLVKSLCTMLLNSLSADGSLSLDIDTSPAPSG